MGKKGVVFEFLINHLLGLKSQILCLDIGSWKDQYKRSETEKKKRRPGFCLNPQWCVQWKKGDENIEHLFLHCPYSLKLWKSLWIEFGKNDQLCSSVSSLLSDNRNFSATSKARYKAFTLWKAPTLSICWTIWLERNRRIFEDKKAHWNEV